MRFSSEFLDVIEKSPLRSDRKAVVRTWFRGGFIGNRLSSETREGQRARLATIASELTERASTLKKVSRGSKLIPPMIGKVAHGTDWIRFEQAFNYDGKALNTVKKIVDDEVAGKGNQTADLSEIDAHLIAKSLGEGIATLHANDFSHYGVLPSSIRHYNGELRLYGLGVVLREWADSKTRIEDLGEPSFFPPEMFDRTRKTEIGSWTDVYQLSATLYAITLNEKPPSVLDRLADPKGTSTLIEEKLSAREDIVTSGLADAIQLGLQLSRHKRPQTASEWLALVDISDVNSVTYDASVVADSAGAKTQGSLVGDDDHDVSLSDDDALDAISDTENSPIEAEDVGVPPVPDTYEESSGRKLLVLLSLLGFVGVGGVFASVMIQNERIVDILPQWVHAGDSEISVSDDLEAAIIEDAADDESVSQVDDLEDDIEEDGAVEIPAENSSDAAGEDPKWLLGEWFIDQAKNGCTSRIRISESPGSNKLSFENPDLNVTPETLSYEQFDANSLQTKDWIYKRNENAVTMVSVRDSSQRLTLTRCN